jgi:hypothetical protein
LKIDRNEGKKIAVLEKQLKVYHKGYSKNTLKKDLVLGINFEYWVSLQN